MKAEVFFKKLDEGYYGIPKKPKLIDLHEAELNLLHETPEIIRVDRTVIWNRKKRKEIIDKKLREIESRNSDLLSEWHNTEFEQIAKYDRDLEKMLMEELNMNRDQLYFFIEEFLDNNYNYDPFKCGILKKEFLMLKNLASKINKLFELGNEENIE